jgi:hypothetical protein
MSREVLETTKPRVLADSIPGDLWRVTFALESLLAAKKSQTKG